MNKNQLYIFNATMKDNGYYTCLVTNSFGEFSLNTTVTVSGMVVHHAK